MYERNAIVLENYFDKIIGVGNGSSPKENYENFIKMVEEIKKYKKMIEEEEEIIKKFDETAQKIQEMQNRENEIHMINVKVEEERNNLFNDISENTSFIDQRLEKIEKIIDKNNKELKELRETYIKTLILFIERQKERNKYARNHRTSEANYLSVLKQVNNEFNKFNFKQIQNIKDFITNYQESNEKIIEVILKNGKNERVPFDENAIRIAVNERSKIAIEESDLYITIYDKMKKLLNEINGGSVQLPKFEKTLRDVSAKISFLNAKKEYIVIFLDNERMTSVNGKNAHARLMKEACEKFELDINQIDNLYELIKKETIGKATKKMYKELYNKTYLKNIEEKEKDFEKELTNVKINTGTIINSNYWRIEGIKNIYTIFQDIVSKNFSKDLSEYCIEETNNNKENKKVKDDKKNKKENLKTKTTSKRKVNSRLPDISELIEEYSNQFNNNEEDDEEDNYQEVIFDDEEEKAERRKYKKSNKNNNDEDFDEDFDEDDDYDDYYDYYDDDDYDEYENEITEENLENIISNSKKERNKKNTKQDKGLLGKLFKK